MAFKSNRYPDEPKAPGSSRSQWSRVGLSSVHVRLSAFQWFTLAATATLLVALGTIWAILSRPKGIPPAEAIQQAFIALDRGDYQTARRLADQLRVADLDFHQLAGPVFIQAAALRYDAQEHWNPAEKRRLYLIASRYFEEARDRGWPPGREPDGWFMLAETLVYAGRYGESLAAIKQAYEQNPSRRSLLNLLAAEAYRNLDPPDPAGALTHLRRYLKDPNLSSLDRAQGQLLLVRALLATDELDEADAVARALLAEAAQNASKSDISRAEKVRWSALLRDGRVWQAYVWLRQADSEPTRAAELYDQAIGLLEPLPAQSQETAISDYLLAELYERRGDAQRLEEQLIRVARRYYGTSEGQLAAIRLAELYLEQGRVPSAVDYVLTALEQKPESSNELLPNWSQRQRRMLAVYRAAIERREFAEAERLSSVLELLVPRTQALLYRAEANAAWGQQSEQQAVGKPHHEVATFQQQAADRFEQAAQLYEQLATLRYGEREYTDDLWRAAEYYLRGNRFTKASELLRKYLVEEPRQRRPRALLWLGEALLSLGAYDEAYRHFEHCYAAYRNDPDAYRARLRAAQALVEKGQWQDAEQVVLENLEQEGLTPASPEWRDSLFFLAELYHRRAATQLSQIWDLRFVAHLDPSARRAVETALEQVAPLLQNAIARWTEWVKRYADDPRTVQAQYTMAADHRYAALLPAWRLQTEVIQSQRRDLAEEVQQHYRTALKIYDDLAQQLDRLQDQRPLSPLERKVQRNVYFLKAHTLFDMGDYRGALDAYSAASNRYQNDPACLEAFQQIAACYRLLRDPDKARGTREQARIVANSLPADVDYTRTTRYPRDVWLQVLQ